jgi:hypothetical protein
VNRGRSGPPRRTPSGSARRLSLLVFAEGEATEKQYLTDWHRRHRHRVNVEFSPDNGTPLHLVEEAVRVKQREAREEKRGRGRAHDQVWCIFDRDEHPFLPEAFAPARKHGVRTAFSNPCLELWFLWHFQDQTGHIERREAQRTARGYLGCDKNLTEAALKALALPERFAAARKRAQALETKHLGDGSPAAGNPSSDVWQLIDLIRGT